MDYLPFTAGLVEIIVRFDGKARLPQEFFTQAF